MNHKLLDQFYTKPVIAKKYFAVVENFIQKENINFDTWLEPSAGFGAFFNLLPNNKIGIDLDPKIPNIIQHDFLTFPLEDKKYVTIGNPPFGKNSSLAIKFFNQCAKKSQIIAFILPKTFKKESTLKKIDPYFHLVFQEDLPSFSFKHNVKDVDVPCVFQIWIKKEYKRIQNKKPTSHPDFLFTTRNKATFAIQRVGANAGRIKQQIDTIAGSSHYFIAANELVLSIFKSIDWNSVKYNTAGNPSISKTELIELYNSHKNLI